MKLLGALGIDWKTFLIQAGNFLVLFLILKWLFFDSFIKAIKKEKEKAERISRGERDLQKKKEEIEKQEEEIIRRARKRAEEIIMENEKVTEKERENILQKMEAETREVLKEARKRAEAEVEKMKRREEEEIIERTKDILKDVLSRSFSQRLHQEYTRETIDKLERLDFGNLGEKEIITVSVASAYPLDRKYKKRISDFLFSKLKNPVLKESLDRGLIAGIKITMGDFIIDGSLREKIKRAI